MKSSKLLTQGARLLQKQLPQFRTNKPPNKQQALIAAEQRINELHLLLGLGNKAKLGKDDFKKEHINALNQELEDLKSSNQQYNPEDAKKRKARRQELEVLMPLISRLKDGNGQLTHGQSAQINQLERAKAVTWSTELQELLFPNPLDNKLPFQPSIREEVGTVREEVGTVREKVDTGKDWFDGVKDWVESFSELFCEVLDKVGNRVSTVGLISAAVTLTGLSMCSRPAIENSQERGKPISENNSVFHIPNK